MSIMVRTFGIADNVRMGALRERLVFCPGLLGHPITPSISLHRLHLSSFLFSKKRFLEYPTMHESKELSRD